MLKPEIETQVVESEWGPRINIVVRLDGIPVVTNCAVRHTTDEASLDSAHLEYRWQIRERIEEACRDISFSILGEGWRDRHPEKYNVEIDWSKIDPYIDRAVTLDAAA